jgi:hypothetical protein
MIPIKDKFKDKMKWVVLTNKPNLFTFEVAERTRWVAEADGRLHCCAGTGLVLWAAGGERL